ncbi:hypothetical protein LR48_Vigan01g201600 [Vigna angularis]|uniref:Uncharacterized protein n=1 Tax=Phaseolus angularis TaxID=3914 RepID=A0A0L9TPJ6_PHAAN|nr:hypothetical protein LR48_Vigan01g201600 [Vigna angularis]
MEGKLNALEGRIEGWFVVIESTLEELKVGMRAMTLSFQRTSGPRSRNHDRSSEGSHDSIIAERERRPPESSEDEVEDGRGDVQRS